MKITSKVRVLNFFRRVFLFPALEAWLVSKTVGKSAAHFYSKLVPNFYQYPVASWRRYTRDGIDFRSDISDYLQHYHYFGFVDKSMERLYSMCIPGARVIDVGSNVGYVALAIARRVSPGVVLGFEPDRDNFEQCIENLRLNTISNIRILNCGLGEKNGTATLEVRSGRNRSGHRVSPYAKGAKIEIRSMDGVVDELSWSGVDLIKIDVEGFELKVLRGAVETIRKFRPQLFIEVNDSNLRDQGDTAHELISFLEGLGYETFFDAHNGMSLSRNFDFRGLHLDIIAR